MNKNKCIKTPNFFYLSKFKSQTNNFLLSHGYASNNGQKKEKPLSFHSTLTIYSIVVRSLV